jgi:hypothetical protein
MTPHVSPPSACSSPRFFQLSSISLHAASSPAVFILGVDAEQKDQHTCRRIAPQLSLSLNHLHTHLSPQHQSRCPLTLLVWTWKSILLHTALTTRSGSCVCGAITVIIKGGYKDAKGVVYVFRCISDWLSLTLLLHSCHCTSCKKRGGSRASQTLFSLSNDEY